MFSDQVHKIPCASYVIEHIVSPSKEDVFRDWQISITRAASKYEGYLGTDMYPPVEEGQNKWYIMVHFDNSNHLTHWLQSRDRQQLVDRGHKTFQKFKTYYKTGLERWLLREKAAPPAWKQNLSVLLGLYPIVMGLLLLETAFPVTSSLSRADAMLVSNFLSCSLLGWIVMPLVTWLFRFWLLPTGQASISNNWTGFLIIVFALALMRSFFNALPK